MDVYWVMGVLPKKKLTFSHLNEVLQLDVQKQVRAGSCLRTGKKMPSKWIKAAILEDHLRRHKCICIAHRRHTIQGALEPRPGYRHAATYRPAARRPALAYLLLSINISRQTLLSAEP